MNNDTAQHRPVPPLTGDLADYLDLILTGTGHDAATVLAALAAGQPSDLEDAMLAEIRDGYTASTALNDLHADVDPAGTQVATDAATNERGQR